jgi:hypothetical protein
MYHHTQYSPVGKGVRHKAAYPSHGRNTHTYYVQTLCIHVRDICWGPVVCVSVQPHSQSDPPDPSLISPFLEQSDCSVFRCVSVESESATGF